METMKTQSGESVRMDILGSVGKLFWDIVAQVFWFMAFVIVAALAPMILVALPLWLLWQNPNADLVWLEQVVFYVAPFSCAFYMVVLCHWHSVRYWQRMGYDLGTLGSNWREAHGGIFCTTGKAILFMVVGLVGSYLFEVLYILAFQYVPYSFPGRVRVALGFALFPFAAFAPVILLLVKRRNYSEAV
jgi:hypothetical protein